MILPSWWPSDKPYLIGGVLDKLALLPDKSVQCMVTSPPYWGLRDYGTATWEGGDTDCDHFQNYLSSDKSTLHEKPEKKKMETGITFGSVASGGAYRE